MNPDQFNLLAGLNSVQPDSGLSSLDNTSPGDLTLSAVDASGNSTMPSLPGLGSVLKIGGDVLSAFGDFAVGNEKQAAYEYNANLALQQGDFQVSDIDAEEADTLSSQKAVYAKSGVVMSGSALDTAFNTASQFEMDKQIATYNAQSKANMDIYEGKAAKSQADAKGGMALLQGATDLALLFL